MSRVAEAMAALDAELAECAKRAEDESARATALASGLSEIATVLERHGFVANAARDELHNGATAAAWAERFRCAGQAMEDAKAIAASHAARMAAWTAFAEQACALLGILRHSLANGESQTALADRILSAIGDVCREEDTEDDMDDEEEQDPIRDAIERSDAWTVEDVERELTQDPMFLAKALGMNHAQCERAAAYASRLASAPQQQKIPDDARRFAVNIHELTEAEAEALWRSLSDEDRPAKFRATLTEEYVAGVVARRVVGPVAEARPATDGPPTKKQDARSRTEATSPCPDVATLLYHEIYEHGSKCGFDRPKVEALADAFRAEALKADRRATRWGAAFRGYLTETARQRDRAR